MFRCNDGTLLRIEPLRTGTGLPIERVAVHVSPRVDRTDPDGLDYGWIMQVTFVTTIVLGTPIVAGLSLLTRLPTWESRVWFAVRVGAIVWLLTAVAVYLYARRYRGVDADAG